MAKRAREKQPCCGSWQIKVTALAPITWENEPVSSSRIRRCLAEGNTELAGTLLGVPYSVCGRAVRQGDELALRWPEEMARPADGSYRGRDEGRPVLLTVREIIRAGKAK